MRIVGQLLDDKYRIEKLIGQGGMGAVFRAVHEGTGRLVALKVITPELMVDELVVERFRREARAAGQLRHPSIVNVTDFGFAAANGERLAYLVMDHLEGQTLAELLETERRLDLGVAVDILRQACEGVEEAHRHGIVHRDLKPENIWLERGGAQGGYRVKVLDFGIAKLRADQAEQAVGADEPAGLATDIEIREHDCAPDPESPTLVVTTPSDSGHSPPAGSGLSVGELLGTPLYMSPEQWLHRSVDARTDVYSLGVIAYRMLAGEVPFLGRTSSLFMEHVRAPPPPLAARAPELPAAVTAAVMAALEKDPARRPPSAQAFATTLVAAAEGGGALVRRAVSLTVEHFPALVRLALLVYAPILALAALRIVNCRLVAAGAIPVATARVLGRAAISLHLVCVVFLLPVCMGLFTPLVQELERAPRKAPRALPSVAEILRNLRGSWIPATVTTGLAVTLMVALRLLLEGLAKRGGLDVNGTRDLEGVKVITTALIETLGIVAFVFVMRGFSVYPSVVAMERRGGFSALSRARALTQPCRSIAAATMLFHFLPTLDPRALVPARVRAALAAALRRGRRHLVRHADLGGVALRPLPAPPRGDPLRDDGALAALPQDAPPRRRVARRHRARRVACRRMFWVALTVSGLLLAYAVVRARRLGPLFADEHLSEIARLLPELKRRALAAPDDPASLHTTTLAVGYTIARDEGVWSHHLSVSSPVTPARAAGTFFLGLVRGALGLDGPPAEVFVSQHQVFHLIVRLTDDEQKAFVDRPIEALTPLALRDLAIAGRSALMPRLVERAVPGAGALAPGGKGA